MAFFKKHRMIVFQLLAILAALFIIYWIGGFLPGILGLTIKIIVILFWVILLGTMLAFFTLQIIENFRLERSFVPDKLQLQRLPFLKKYQILNPLAQPGSFHKAQFHTHSSISYDSNVPPEEVIESYRQDGYDIIALTDHDKLSDFSSYSSKDCLVLPGIEETVPVLFWPIPLGKHLILINPSKKRPHTGTVQERLDQAIHSDSLVIPAHLSWRGGAGTGRWFPKELSRLKNLRFVEIDSPHSKDPIDLTIWHTLIIKGGPDQPVWGLAVDDSHSGCTNYGWVMVKTANLELSTVIAALKQGAFYATNGPSLDIKVEGGTVSASSPEAVWIRFINAQNQVIGAFRGKHAEYQSHGDEGFIRIEATAENGHTAWSQPMWLVSAENNQ